MTLPEPLIDAEVDLRDFAFMPLHVQRLRDSKFASEENPEAFRSGLLLWCAAWHQLPAGSLPDDDRELAKLSGFGRAVDAWKAVRAGALYGFVLCSDGRLYHPVIVETANKSWASKLEERYKRFLDRLRKANKARQGAGHPIIPTPTFDTWRQMDRAGTAGIPTEGDLFSKGLEDEAHGTSHSSAGNPADSSLKGKGREVKLREGISPSGKRAPADFVVTDDMAAWARQNAPHADIERETAKFRDHQFANARSDWPATWRNWLRRASDESPAARRLAHKSTGQKYKAGVWPPPEEGNAQS